MDDNSPLAPRKRTRLSAARGSPSTSTDRRHSRSSGVNRGAPSSSRQGVDAAMGEDSNAARSRSFEALMRGAPPANGQNLGIHQGNNPAPIRRSARLAAHQNAQSDGSTPPPEDDDEIQLLLVRTNGRNRLSRTDESLRQQMGYEAYLYSSGRLRPDADANAARVPRAADDRNWEERMAEYNNMFQGFQGNQLAPFMQAMPIRQGSSAQDHNQQQSGPQQQPQQMQMRPVVLPQAMNLQPQQMQGAGMDPYVAGYQYAQQAFAQYAPVFGGPPHFGYPFGVGPQNMPVLNQMVTNNQMMRVDQIPMGMASPILQMRMDDPMMQRRMDDPMIQMMLDAPIMQMNPQQQQVAFQQMPHDHGHMFPIDLGQQMPNAMPMMNVMPQQVAANQHLGDPLGLDQHNAPDGLQRAVDRMRNVQNANDGMNFDNMHADQQLPASSSATGEPVNNSGVDQQLADFVMAGPPGLVGLGFSNIQPSSNSMALPDNLNLRPYNPIAHLTQSVIQTVTECIQKIDTVCITKLRAACRQISELILVSSEDNPPPLLKYTDVVTIIKAVLTRDDLSGGKKTAIFCLTHMVESYARSHEAASALIPDLVNMLEQMSMTFETDLSEAALEPLKILSVEFGLKILRLKGIPSVLRYVDFFTQGHQRIAFETAANAAGYFACVEPQLMEQILDVLSLIINNLTHNDGRIADSARYIIGHLGVEIARLKNESADSCIETFRNGFARQLPDILRSLSPQNARTLQFLHGLRVIMATMPTFANQLRNMRIHVTVARFLGSQLSKRESLGFEEVREVMFVCSELAPNWTYTEPFDIDEVLYMPIARDITDEQNKLMLGSKNGRAIADSIARAVVPLLLRRAACLCGDTNISVTMDGAHKYRAEILRVILRLINASSYSDITQLAAGSTEKQLELEADFYYVIGLCFRKPECYPDVICTVTALQILWTMAFKDDCTPLTDKLRKFNVFEKLERLEEDIRVNLKLPHCAQKTFDSYKPPVTRSHRHRNNSYYNAVPTPTSLSYISRKEPSSEGCSPPKRGRSGRLFSNSTPEDESDLLERAKKYLEKWMPFYYTETNRIFTPRKTLYEALHVYDSPANMRCNQLDDAAMLRVAMWMRRELSRLLALDVAYKAKIENVETEQPRNWLHRTILLDDPKIHDMCQNEAESMSLCDWIAFWNRQRNQDFLQVNPMDFAEKMQGNVLNSSVRPEVVRNTLKWLMRSVAAMYNFHEDFQVNLMSIHRRVNVVAPPSHIFVILRNRPITIRLEDNNPANPIKEVVKVESFASMKQIFNAAHQRLIVPYMDYWAEHLEFSIFGQVPDEFDRPELVPVDPRRLVMDVLLEFYHTRFTLEMLFTNGATFELKCLPYDRDPMMRHRSEEIGIALTDNQRARLLSLRPRDEPRNWSYPLFRHDDPISMSDYPRKPSYEGNKKVSRDADLAFRNHLNMFPGNKLNFNLGVEGRGRITAGIDVTANYAHDGYLLDYSSESISSSFITDNKQNPHADAYKLEHPDYKLYVRIYLLCSKYHGMKADEWEENPKPVVEEDDYVCKLIDAKVNLMLDDFFTWSLRRLPRWVRSLVVATPRIFRFETRRALFAYYSIGANRYISWWLNERDMPSDDFNGSKPSRYLAEVRRDNILESAVRLMKKIPSDYCLEVKFQDEPGTGHGPTQEFYTLLSKELQRLDLHLWMPIKVEQDENKRNIACSDVGLYPLPQTSMKSKAVKYFELLGRVLAQALLDGYRMDIVLSDVCMKWLIGFNQSITTEDIFNIDPNTFNVISSIAHSSDQELDDMLMPFSIPNVDVKLGVGRDAVIDASNKDKYLKVVKHCLLGLVCNPMLTILGGFEAVFHDGDLKVFTHNDFERLFCGVNGSDGTEWKKQNILNTLKFDLGYGKDSHAVNFLVDMMVSLTPDRRRKFLMFVTGSPRLPVGGFAALSPPLTVVMKSGIPGRTADNELPTAVACKNYLKLPNYSSNEVFLDKFEYALLQPTKFDFN